MSAYELEDYSDRPESLIKLCEYPTVTTTNITEIREIISYIQLPLYQVQEGDDLVIYIVDNRNEGIKGFLALWRNKGIACINTGGTTVWGEWNEAAKILLSDEFEAGEDNYGDTIVGRIAFNTHGIRGIYAQGKFYKLLENASNIKPVTNASAINQMEQVL